MSANKIQLTKNDESVLFTFTDSKHYLTGNGQIEVPLNSLSLVIDSSDMVTFRKAASNDIFLSAPISDFGMSKAELEEWYAENMVGGTGGSVDPSDLSGLVATAVYVSSSSTIDFKNMDGDVISSINAEPFITDGMVDNVQISGTNLVITFNVDAGKQPISIPLSSIFDPSNYYDKTATDTLLNGKVAVSDYNTYTAATNTALSGKADTSAVTNPYLLDFWGIGDETVEVTDELFEEWIDAFENGRPFYTNNDEGNYFAPLSVDHSDPNAFEFFEYYNDGYDSLSVTRVEDKGEWVYTVEFEGRSSLPYIFNRNSLNPSNFNEGTWLNIMSAIENNLPILMKDGDGLYPVSVFTEDGEWMYINVRYYSTVVSCSDLMLVIHKIDDGEGDVEFEITDHITDIDSALNSGSTNPVMNSAVTVAIDAVNASLSGKQDTLIAGSGITISGNVISADGGASDPNKLDVTAFTAYSAATATAISGKVDTVDYDEAQRVTATALNDLNDRKQDTLIAGSGITISGNVISAEGGGGSITIDPTLDTGSTNAVANSAITEGFNAYTCRQNTLDGEVRYFYFPSPANPYGNVNIRNFSINGRCPLTKSNGTNDYIDKFSLVETSAITTSMTSGSTDSQVPSAKAVYDTLGGLRFVKCSQAEYDALTTKDPMTIYIITNVVNNA